MVIAKRKHLLNIERTVVGSVSASRTVGREFASRPGHTKAHKKWYKLPPCIGMHALG